MPTPKTEPHPLWAELRVKPDDTLKLALADYLEENGDTNTGYALRWCVAHDRWPRVTKSLLIWNTDPTQQHPGKKKDVTRSLLPVLFFAVADGATTREQLRRVTAGSAFWTLADAIGYLGDILAGLRRTISVDRVAAAAPN